MAQLDLHFIEYKTQAQQVKNRIHQETIYMEHQLFHLFMELATNVPFQKELETTGIIPKEFSLALLK